jgi:hypothetical protein
MVALLYATTQEAEAGGLFEASPGYLARACQKKKKDNDDDDERKEGRKRGREGGKENLCSMN